MNKHQETRMRFRNLLMDVRLRGGPIYEHLVPQMSRQLVSQTGGQLVSQLIVVLSPG